MVTRKILFGSIVFFSLAFLAACGGGGSGSSGGAGAAGAAGADGATGATGSITVFEDANLLASFNGAAGALPGSTPTLVPLDSGAAIGSLSGYLAATGLDNLTPNSPVRYYQYIENAAGVQTPINNAGAGTIEETLMNAIYDIQDDAIFDSRMSAGVGLNTLTNFVPAAPQLILGADTVSKTLSSFAVCPGNMAGDGACSKVLAPAYDRGIGTASPQTYVRSTDLNTSIVHVGSGVFNSISDNGTGGGATPTVTAAWIHKFSAAKSTSGSAEASDNISAALDAIDTYASVDNDTRWSNLILRGSNVWWAQSEDNSSVAAYSNECCWGEGDNVSLSYRPADASAVATDNGSTFTNITALTTAPRIEDAGDGVYVFFGAGDAITAYNVRDNGTTDTLGPITAAGTQDTWCTTSDSTGSASTFAVVVSDNNTKGWWVDAVYDNGTTTRMTDGITVHAVMDSTGQTQVSPDFCAVTHLDGTTYLAVSDEDGTSGDNVSVWKSTDLATWSQIGTDLDMTTGGNVNSIAIGTTGTTASDNAVWVAVNDDGAIEVVHYEDIAGGTSYAWRSVGTVLTGASTSGVSITTDGTSVIAVSAIIAGKANVGFWYNQ